MSQDLFDEIYEAHASGKSDNFTPGKGVVCIKKIICEKMNEGKTFVLESVIVSSEEKVVGRPPNKPGTTVGWPQKLEKFKSAKGNVLGCMLAIVGKNKDEITKDQFKELFEKMVSGAQPATGILLAYETRQAEVTSGARKGQENTYVNFRHVEAGNTKEEIAARRAKLEKNEPL